MTRPSRIAVALVLALLVAGCANFTYYLQSVRGQIDIWSRTRDIEALIASPDTAHALRERLREVLSMREYASAELGMPRNESFRSYANLERPYAVWNVFAASEFSIEPRQWCFLFAGCVGYRGYFRKSDAERFAARIAGEGDDVFVGGVPAYSLLGYFPDPVLSTFINRPTPHLAALIFHELAHQVVYVRDDTVFNESFAVTVEREGLRRWIARHGAPEYAQGYETMSLRRADFLALLETYRRKLGALYSTRLAPEAMRSRKAELFAQIRVDYQALRESWGGFPGYDRWFAEAPNNALIASVGIYTQRVPAFQALLAQEGGDLPRFYEAVKKLARMGKAQRNAVLDGLVPRAAGAPD